MYDIKVRIERLDLWLTVKCDLTLDAAAHWVVNQRNNGETRPLAIIPAGGTMAAATILNF
jgi:hypothetical protein